MTIQKFRGFISDMDGVVANTEEFWFIGTNNFLRKFGKVCSRDEYAKYIGTLPITNTRKITTAKTIKIIC